MQLEEDTDRDRYMSPLEAKSYGLIDHVIGGDDAGFKFTVRRCNSGIVQQKLIISALQHAVRVCCVLLSMLTQISTSARALPPNRAARRTSLRPRRTM